ncbi:hypothetical protein A35E_00409 [secondary endosymbiont of Heteropsylla cubana]|uniref:Uncharacterized protein n=1 Tax=secondary endosymbiont of Heteropsylla cubana TaxID=134287 RepID=J3YTC7_9ENTR|nr:hypothetical protein [secondary endosymbiont of Heteropsylla cubana]AFP85703.1 hypothetical protein A35E_00409 [secondary endosymbiont of Heteropsylla cubana]
MVDSIDIASQNEEAFRQHVIANHRGEPLPITGRCYNCGELTEGNFCSKECGEDWEKRKFFESQKLRG